MTEPLPLSAIIQIMLSTQSSNSPLFIFIMRYCCLSTGSWSPPRLVWCGFPSGFLLSVKCLINLIENRLITAIVTACSPCRSAGTLALPLCSFGYRTVKVLADSNSRSTQRKTSTVAGQLIFGIAKLNGQVLGQFTLLSLTVDI